MNRDILLYRLCPMHRIYDCCNSDTNFHCVDCTRVMNEWIDGYDKQIRSDAIDEFKDNLIKLIRLREESHFYDISEHDYEWLISDIMYSAKKLKEKIEKEQKK